MNDVALFLLSVAGIFLLGALGEIVFQRTNIPDVIWLILAGILLGPLTGLVTREFLNRIAPFFAAITLVVVLFEGGSALRLRELSRAAPRSTLLAVLTFGFALITITLLSIGARLVGLLPAEWTWMHGLMLGAILGARARSSSCPRWRKHAWSRRSPTWSVSNRHSPTRSAWWGRLR